MQRRSGRRQPQDSKNSSSTENHADGELMGGDGTTKGKAYQPSPATRVHDNINIVVLSFMSILATWSMYEHLPAVQYGLTVFAMGYMLLDAIYIISYLDSVRDPKAILAHHAATIIVLFDPLMIPNHALYTSWALMVEINTTLLILRRRVSWGGSWLVEVLFVLTWIGLRLIWYPIITVIIILATFTKTLTPYYPFYFIMLFNCHVTLMISMMLCLAHSVMVGLGFYYLCTVDFSCCAAPFYISLAALLFVKNIKKQIFCHLCDVLIDWRYRIETASGGQPTQVYKLTAVAWIVILLFQGWWSLALFRSYRRMALSSTQFYARNKFV